MKKDNRISSPVYGDAREWAGIAVALVFAAFVYEPWAGTSLPLPDFGTFLPLVDRSENLLAQLSSVVRFYAGEGRLCLFPYILFVFGANAFGTWAQGWYLTYFALNAVVISLFWFVLRRMNVPRTATLLAAALWIPMTATTELWLRPTGEPFALIFFLSAVLIAIGFDDSLHWRRDALVIAALSVGVLYSKEILIALLPAGWMISRLSYKESTLQWRQWGSRDTYLLLSVVGGVLLAAIPIALVAASAPAGSYASGFGDAAPAGRILWDRIAMVLLPTTAELGNLMKLSADPWWILVLALPNLIWLRLLGEGVRKSPRKLLWPVAIAVLWASVGLLAYAPWRDPQTFYMAPFALGSMFGAAHLIGSLLRQSRKAAAGAVILASILVVISAVEANSRMRRYRMRADLNAGVLNQLANTGTVRVIGAAVPVLPREQRWGWARHLAGFKKFEAGAAVAKAEDYTCAAARKELEEHPGVVIVSRDRGCGRLSEASVAIDGSTYRSQWPWLWERHIVADRMYVTVSASAPDQSRVISSLD